MSTRVPIQYRDFWDVPRIFVARYQDQNFLFDCAFDEHTEDYPDLYKVYLMPELREKDLAGSWDKLSGLATQFLGEVLIARVQFDSTGRREIHTDILDELKAAMRRPLVRGSANPPNS